MKVTNFVLFASRAVASPSRGSLGTTDRVSSQVSLGTILNTATVRFALSPFSGKASSFEEEDGTGTGKNEVRIKLSRGDLGSQFSCQAENEAIDQPLSTSVQVDVNRE